MRTRSAKKLAQRIDLYYFKHANPLRRWRTLLSIALPVLGLLWLGTLATAGSRAAYSSGPVSTAHAFTEAKCEVCHVRDTAFRAHVADTSCVTCHDAPAHAVNQVTTPECATCHREHQGRVRLAATADQFCVNCHGNLTTRDSGAGAPGPKVARTVTRFPSGHPEFAAAAAGAVDPGTLKFNHEVHLKDGLRGPSGPEKLECVGCHKPEISRVSARAPVTGEMARFRYADQCARCHPLFFDERIDDPAPHTDPGLVRLFVQQSLGEYIAAHPGDITKVDPPSRRVPLNFPREPELPARTPAEWVARRAARAERLLWAKSCAECHQVRQPASQNQLPAIAPTNVKAQWMPKAAFDHAPHLMVDCASCHQAATSRATADVLMPKTETCATCHAPEKGAESRCFECHGYHDWTKAHAIGAKFRLTDFK